MNTTDQSTTSPVTSPATRKRPRVRRVVIALLLAALGVGWTVQSASAWNSPSANGSYGSVSPRGVQGTKVYYKEPSALYGSQVAAINVTGVGVGRSPGTWDAQRIEYRFSIFQWSGGRWVKAYDSQTAISYIYAGQSSTVFNPQEVRTGNAGYFRVTFSIVWRDSHHRYLGARNFDYSHASDYRCLVPVCQVGHGWIYL